MKQRDVFLPVDFQKMHSKTPLSKVHGAKKKKKNKKYHTVGTVPKSNIKIVEIGKFFTPNAQMYDSLLTWICIGTSRKWKKQVIDKIHPENRKPSSEVSPKMKTITGK